MQSHLILLVLAPASKLILLFIHWIHRIAQLQFCLDGNQVHGETTTSRLSMDASCLLGEWVVHFRSCLRDVSFFSWEGVTFWFWI